MRNVSHRIVEKIKTRFVFNNFFAENRTVYEMMMKNIIRQATDDSVIRRMRIACVS